MPINLGLENSKVSLNVRAFFFDRKLIMDRMSEANRKALSKVGAFIRRRARSSLRRRRKVSEPGSPPSVHSADSVATLKNIIFAYDPFEESLVVGPVRLNQVEDSWIDMGRTTVPQLHEFGDIVRVLEWSWDGGRTWSRRDRRVRHTSRKRKEVYHFIERRRRARYRARPFMGPAMEAERPNIPDAWEGTLSNSGTAVVGQ